MKKYKKLISIFLCCIIISLFLVLPVSAVDFDYSDYYRFTSPSFAKLYNLYDDFDSTFVEDNFEALPFSGRFSIGTDDSYGLYEYYYPDNNIFLESGSIYICSFEFFLDIEYSDVYYSFPESLEFKLCSDVFPDFYVPNVSVLDNTVFVDFTSVSECYFFVLLYPKSNYDSLYLSTSTTSIPLSPPDTSMPPFKVVISTISDYITTNFSWGSEVFSVVSSTPGLLILCLAFPILAFLLGWMRRLINSS